jgi:type II secretory pathway component GspD/PulD (secretin)
VSRQFTTVTKILILLLFFTLLSCTRGKVDPYDRLTGLNRTEIQKTLLKDPNKNKNGTAKNAEQERNAPIPNVSKLLISPPPPEIGGDKIISFSVTEQVPLKDVLVELGRLTKIDIDIDPKISGGIILNAKDRPLKEVLDRIATLGKLRYTYNNGVLYFQTDSPYMKNYYVDYLQNGSVWGEVENNLRTILSAGSGRATSNTNTNSNVATATNANNNLNSNAANPATNSATNTTKNTTSNNNTNRSGSASGSSASSSFTSPSGSSFSSNRSAGIISIFATGKEHDMIAKYVTDVEKYASAQVLIEAKVVEVTLNDEYKTGIDWSSDQLTTQNGFATARVKGASSSPIAYVASGIFNTNLTASIAALEIFGMAKAISSPRLNAINNQTATLDFSQKYIYFTISTSTSTATNGVSSNVVASTVTATKNEVPFGVQLAITPSINLRTNEITLNVQPKLTIRGEDVDDPSVNPKDGTSLNNKVPTVSERTLNTIAKIQSGNILIIGGLMQDTTDNKDTGIPFLQRIPVLGWLFKSVSKSSKVVETVIFIKATIINSGSQIDKSDRALEKFDPSKRQLFTQ